MRTGVFETYQRYADSRGADSDAENKMLKLNCSRWNQSIDVLPDQALSAEHPRIRERWMALYEIEICIGKNATTVDIF